MMTAYAVQTATNSELLLYSTMKYQRFQFVSNFYYFRLSHFESCPNINADILPLTYVLQGLTMEHMNNKKVFKVADKLIKIGCDVNEYNNMGLTALQLSIISAEPEAAEFLLQKRADPYKKAIDGAYSLMETYSFTRYTGMNAFNIAENLKASFKEKNDNQYIKMVKIIGLLNSKI